MSRMISAFGQCQPEQLFLVSQDEAEFLDEIFLTDKVADREPDTLEEELLSIYCILRHNSPDYDIHSDPISLWVDTNFSAA